MCPNPKKPTGTGKDKYGPFGKVIENWSMHQRLEKAKALLKETNDPKQIVLIEAYMLGFTGNSWIHRKFTANKTRHENQHGHEETGRCKCQDRQRCKECLLRIKITIIDGTQEVLPFEGFI